MRWAWEFYVDAVSKCTGHWPTECDVRPIVLSEGPLESEEVAIARKNQMLDEAFAEGWLVAPGWYGNSQRLYHEARCETVFLFVTSKPRELPDE